MKVMKNAIKASLVLALAASSAFAQNIDDAKKAIDAEQYQKAKDVLKKLITEKPAEPENYFFLGNVYLKTDYIDSAKATYNKGVAADAKNPLNYVGLGAVDLSANNTAAAKANFDKAIELKKRKDELPLLYIGRAYIDTKKPDYTTAINYLEQAKALNEKNAEVYLALGDAHRAMKDNSAAYSDYRTAYDMDNKLLRAKVELGVINKQSKAFKESADEFNSVLAIDPNYGPAYRELAETYYLWANAEPKEYDTRIKQALQYYEKYIDLTDKSLDSRMRHADFLILAKDYKALEAEAQAMSQIDKTNPRIFRYLGYSAYENGNYAASEKAIQEFINKVDSSRVIARDYLYLGKAQLKTDTTANSKGFANLEKAVDMDSTIADDMSDIAKELYTARKYGEAARIYELATQSPKVPLLDYYYLGVSHYFDYGAKKTANLNPDKQILVQADSAFSKLLQRSPTTEQAILYRARIHRLMDDENDSQGLAVPYYQQYVELVTVTRPEKAEKNKTQMVEAYTYLGSVSARKDQDNAKALEYFNKGLALDPQNATLLEAKKAVSGS
ncbi:hypothetical protein FW774_04630 (plasmid) [Pedobacter sp. BS3]|uniref:tetratricopeptide repeat protein n=1 Tax=Pedobacter sp. BS3 TaxID=2567937 RepID=UPI0011EFD9AC|nr:tetratricopeptide repeat protein [Pedobacter sp. BS3]TZF86337.1 hypothetical protein FW774_04630 [Pedobacter sp. BS3]